MELRKKLGCLHAHYSNIEYRENVPSPFNIELIHIVDPALMYRVTSDGNFQESDAQKLYCNFTGRPTLNISANY